MIFVLKTFAPAKVLLFSHMCKYFLFFPFFSQKTGHQPCLFTYYLFYNLRHACVRLRATRNIRYAHASKKMY